MVVRQVQGKLDFPHYIAADSTGAIYVAEIKNWRVRKFARTAVRLGGQK
jgi:hypothetical protein